MTFPMPDEELITILGFHKHLKVTRYHIKIQTQQNAHRYTINLDNNYKYRPSKGLWRFTP